MGTQQDTDRPGAGSLRPLHAFLYLSAAIFLGSAQSLLAGEKAEISAFLKNESSLLGIQADAEGKCLYGKSEMNRMQLEKRYPQEFNHHRYDDENASLSRLWDCLFLRQNFERDETRLFPAVEATFTNSALAPRHVDVRGKLHYVGLAAEPYRYAIDFEADGSITVSVRIHYYPSKRLAREPDLDQILENLRWTVSRAEDLWNAEAPENVRYRFLIVDHPEEADYSVKLTYQLRAALYFRRIPAIPEPHLFAHEIGHMMGLDDEYSYWGQMVPYTPADFGDRALHHPRRKRGVPFSEQRDLRCFPDSLMCSGFLDGAPRPYHHYLILRRGLLGQNQ